MKLSEFIEWINGRPDLIIGYFLLIPVVALLMWFVAKNEGHNKPWRDVYSLLVYAVCVPGITAFAFNIYLFVFQRQNIYDTNLFVQVLPILSMIVTLWLIRKNVMFEHIPGFGKVSQMITIICAAMMILWLGDKVRIYSFTYVPLWQILLIFAGLILAIRYAWQKLF